MYVPVLEEVFVTLLYPVYLRGGFKVQLQLQTLQLLWFYTICVWRCWGQLLFQILCCCRGNNDHWPYYVPWSNSCMTRTSGLVGSFQMQKIVFWHQDVFHNKLESVLYPGRCFLSVQIVASPMCWGFWLSLGWSPVHNIRKILWSVLYVLCILLTIGVSRRQVQVFVNLQRRGGALCSACCGFDGLGGSNSFSFVGM